MKVGDKVWVEAVITRLGEETVDVAIRRDPLNPNRVDHARTYREAVREEREPGKVAKLLRGLKEPT